DEAESVQLGHPDVAEYHLRLLGQRQPQRLLPVRCGKNLIPFVGEDQLQRMPEPRLVVYDENATAAHDVRFGYGKRRWKVVPSPATEATSTRPPSSAMVADTMASPRPVP